MLVSASPIAENSCLSNFKLEQRWSKFVEFSPKNIYK